ncbi:MAG: 50S ribosomal protein L25, partial [Candidatus Latescibacteria bacterium]|nr:50S ribosomal protein L25 [Candidatus Latescibacterota bacterium]
PTDIPDRIVIDVAALEVGDNLHVSDITLENPENTIVTDGERTVFSVAAPSVQRTEEEEAEEAEAEAMQEPEVIERGKKDDEDGEE